MSGKTKGKARPYRSGFCGAGNPPESHARCPGSYRGEACSCEHHTAPAPEAVSEVVQETEATSYDGPAWVDYDMPEDAYHAHEGSVSASELKRVLDCPARYQHERQVPRQPRTVFDVGHAAHAKVLGVGAPVTVIEVVAPMETAEIGRGSSYDRALSMKRALSTSTNSRSSIISIYFRHTPSTRRSISIGGWPRDAVKRRACSVATA